MPLDDLTDDRMDALLRELLERPEAASQEWRDAARGRLTHFIVASTGDDLPATEPNLAAEVHREGNQQQLEFGAPPAAGASRRWLLAGAAAAIVMVVGLTLLTNRGDRTTTTSSAPVQDDAAAIPPPASPAWSPPGVVFPLTDLGPAERLWPETVALDALTRRIGVEDHPTLTVYRSLDYLGGESIEEWDCLTSDGGGAGCSPVELVGPSIGVTSSVNNRIAEFNLWTWDNVPSEAAFVVYGAGPGQRWQRPVAGVAAFPNVDWFDSVAVAYTADGTEIARVDPSVLDAARSANEAALASLDTGPTAADSDEVRNVMIDAATTCLTDAGATFAEGSLGRLRGGDAERVWAVCVAFTDRVVREWFAVQQGDVDDGAPLDGTQPWTGLPQVDAGVTSRSLTGTEIQIDRGASHGVRTGMAVINSAGLAGTVSDVTSDSATVRLIHDTESELPVQLFREDQPVGALIGNGDDASLTFESDQPVDTTTGPMLETSAGPDRTVPERIPVGRLTDTPDRGRVVQPWVDLDALQHVTIVLWVPHDDADDESTP